MRQRGLCAFDAPASISVENIFLAGGEVFLATRKKK